MLKLASDLEQNYETFVPQTNSFANDVSNYQKTYRRNSDSFNINEKDILELRYQESTSPRSNNNIPARRNSLGSINESKQNENNELLTKKINDLKHENFKLKQEAYIANNLGQSLYKRNENLTLKLHGLENDNEKLKLDLENANHQIEMLQRHSEVDSQHLRHHMSDLNSQLVDYQQIEKDHQFEIESVKEEIRKLEIENRRLQNMNEELHYENSTLQKEMKRQDEITEERLQQLTFEFEQQINQMKEQNILLKNSNSSFKNKYEKINNKLTTLQNESSTMSTKNIEIQNNSNNVHDNAPIPNVQQLYQEIDFKTQQIGSLQKQLFDSKQFLELTLTLLEDTELLNKTTDVNDIYVHCNKTRKFLGINKSAPLPLPTQREVTPENPQTLQTSLLQQSLLMESEIATTTIQSLPKPKKEKRKKEPKTEKKKEPSSEEQKQELIKFFTTYSDPDNWREGTKENDVQRYILEFGNREPIQARMAFLYCMTLYLGQMVGVNKRCITHVFMLFKSINAQVATLSVEFKMILSTLQYHDDDKLWKYVYSFLFNVSAYFKHIQRFVGSRTHVYKNNRNNERRNSIESVTFIRNQHTIDIHNDDFGATENHVNTNHTLSINNNDHDGNANNK